MAFDAKLAARIRQRLGKRAGLVEKQVFGGIAFLLNGNMCCGVDGEEMIVRLAPGDTDKALAQANTHRFDLTGRPMQGWILVKPKGRNGRGAREVGRHREPLRGVATAQMSAVCLPAATARPTLCAFPYRRSR